MSKEVKYSFGDLFELQPVDHEGFQVANIQLQIQESAFCLLDEHQVQRTIYKTMQDNNIALLSYFGDAFQRITPRGTIRGPTELETPTLITDPQDIMHAIQTSAKENPYIRESVARHKDRKIDEPNAINAFLHKLKMYGSGNQLNEIESNVRHTFKIEWQNRTPQIHFIRNYDLMHRKGDTFIEGKNISAVALWHQDGSHNPEFLLMLSQEANGTVHRSWLNI